MENRKLKLPIGIQSFEDLRNGGCVYVDKTRYLVELIENPRPYFMARPRRFGKTLTLSTFEALFSGKKELFKGLAAEEFMARPDFQTSPVIRLDMSHIDTSNGIEGIKESILYLTREIARQLKIKLSKTKLYGILLSELISRTAEKYGQKVVVLIDEYDKPYTDFVNDSDTANEVRNILRDYYVKLKANYEYIRFIFLTGVSKFTRFGVFSTLNNLDDISMMPEYAGICGYTEEEIIQYFPEYLEKTAEKMNISVEELITGMRKYYNGFSFDREIRESLYNPYSTLKFFSNKAYINYWFQSGTPKYIADYMKDKLLTVEQFRNLPVSFSYLETPGDLDTTEPHGFLYQSGYLTLRPGVSDDLSLDYPNTEVLNAMSELVAKNMLRDSDEDFTRCRTDLLNGLYNIDHEKVIKALNRLLASIPYDDYAKEKDPDGTLDKTFHEWTYRSNVITFLRGCGISTNAEAHTNKGRSDIVVTHKGQTWIIELKVAFEGRSAEKEAEDGLRQMIDNNYAEPYPNATCLCLGINDTKRLITAFRLQK